MFVRAIDRFFDRFKSVMTLPMVLSVPFVVQTFTAVALVGYFSYRHGQIAVNNLVSQLQDDISDRIYQKLDTYLAIPQQVNQINLQAIKLGMLSLQDFQKTGNYFWYQQQVFNLGYINFGNSQGEFIGAGYEKGCVRISEKRLGKPYTIYAVDSKGNRTNVVETKPKAFPNDAAWYNEAVLKNKQIWSEIYNWQDSPDVMAISSSYPVYNQNKQLLGVIGVDLILSEISSFLRNIKVSESGGTFIIERNGMLVASSLNESPYVIEAGEAKRITMNQLANPLAKATTNKLIKDFGSINQIKFPTSINFEIDRKKYFAKVNPWEDNYGLNWLILVVVPESDFMAEIYASKRTTVLLSLLTLVFASSLGVLTACWISQPIMRLSDAAKSLAKKAGAADFDGQVLELNLEVYRIQEMSILAQLFNQMAQKIYHAFNALEGINSELENRVTERTVELKATQNELLALFQAMTELILVLDISGKYLKIVQTQPQFLYKPADELIGYTLHEVFSKSEADFFLEHVQKSLKEQTSVSIEYSLTIANKQTWFSAIISPIDTQSIIFVARDITQVKQTELVLQEALVAAKSASQAKGEFLSKISHELRTPLNIILGFTQVMLRDQNLTEENYINVQTIHRSGNHLLQLINDVLSMSKIEAGQITLKEKIFSLDNFIKTIYEMLEYKAKSKGLDLIIETGENLPQYVQADESKLRQILINLLGNAIKFTEVGRVILRIYGDENSDLDDGNTNQTNEELLQQNKLYFEIEDTGIGISAEEIDNLFTPFIQTKSGRDAMEGTGLGLAISQNFVQAMGGNINVKSTYKEGSIFAFKIPVKFPKMQPQQLLKKEFPEIIGLELNQPKYRILVVDDIVENRDFLTKILEYIGFEVRTIANGKEAIAVWETWQPHLICMDMLMPIMDGYEATRTIKARVAEIRKKHLEINELPPSSDIVIIALTASAFEEERDAIFAAGCDDLIYKPFPERLLLEKISHHLGVRYIYQQQQHQFEALQIAMHHLELTSDDLQIMSEDWRFKLAEASKKLDDICILELIQEIPATETKLITGLKHLVDNFRLDIILELANKS
jgi:signal transduction histidine kinase/CheY-like chemotaxis protein/HAMP domain-containing protein